MARAESIGFGRAFSVFFHWLRYGLFTRDVGVRQGRGWRGSFRSLCFPAVFLIYSSGFEGNSLFIFLGIFSLMMFGESAKRRGR